MSAIFSSRKWALFAALAVAVPSAVVAVSVLPSQAAAAPSAGGTYTLAATVSGRCIDVPSASLDNGALLQQWGCHPDQAWQQFTVKAGATSGQFTIANVNSTRCLDVPSGAATSGLHIQQWGCGDGTKPAQLFTFPASGTGTYQIKNVASGMCLAISASSTANGAPVVQETCAATTNQQWSFNAISGGSAGTCPCTVAKDGTGTYTTVQAAIDAVPTGNTSRRIITIAPGTYREIVTIPSNKPYVTLQGAGTSASATVIVNNHSSAGGYGTSGSATMFIQGHDFAASNVTISNDYGEGSQAVAANIQSDRSIYTNVRFLGNQDTLLTHTGRAYFVNSYVEGTVDFIFGGSIAVFNASTIHQKRATGGPLTAANTVAANTYGYLFYKCAITGVANNVTSLGRPWGADAQVLYRESNLSATIATAQPWTNMSANTWQNARFFEYKNTGPGATVNSNRPQMSDATAANYTPQKYLAGTDGWNPIG